MFRVSCIQLRSNNNINHNLKRTTILIKKAVLQKTDFILTPEVSSQFSLKKKELLIIKLIPKIGIILLKKKTLLLLIQEKILNLELVLLKDQ